MGGPGSGRRRSRLGVDECRALDVGELCGGGRWMKEPRGAVLWRSRPGGATLARLRYVISGQESRGAALLLAYSYQGAAVGPPREQELEIECLPEARPCARCPRCGRRVRTLYAPPRAGLFACRACYGLVYRPSQWREQLSCVQEAAAPALGALEALPRRTRRRARRRYVAAPPPALAGELETAPPGGAAETRLWGLRLRAAGLSYRQIGALLGLSKSSVARLCVAGPKAINRQALVRERLEEASLGPALPQGDDRAGLRAYLRAAHQHALRLGLYHHPISAREERVVLPGDDALGP